jgi:hypothetical protein
MTVLIAKTYPTQTDTAYFGWREVRHSYGHKAAIDNGTWFYEGSSSRSFTSQRSGYQVVGFKQAIRAGGQAGSPYTRSSSRLISLTPGHVTQVKRSYAPPEPGATSYVLRGVRYPPVCKGFHEGLDPSDAVSADNHALVRFYSALRQEMEHWNSLVFLGELREIVALVRRPYATLQSEIDGYLTRYKRRAMGVKFPKALRKADKVRRLTKLAADTWLETAFGVAPTLSDVATAAETLARFLEERRRSRVKGFAQRSGKALPYVITGQTHNHIQYNPTIETVGNVRVMCVAGLDVGVLGDAVSARRLGELAGVNLANLPVTLYELLPYSWLVDYFTTTGACLSSYVQSTAQVRWAIKTTKQTTRWTTSNWVDSKGSTQKGYEGDYCIGTHLGIGVTEWTTLRREILNEANLPRPSIQVRPLSDILPSQVANVVALLASRAAGVSGDVRRHHRI